MSTNTPRSEPIKTSIAPWLSVSRATEAVDYYKAAFGAVERYRLEDDEGSVVVAQLAIGGADFWLQEDVDSSPEFQDRRYSSRKKWTFGTALAHMDSLTILKRR
jgi:PhnB protein